MTQFHETFSTILKLSFVARAAAVESTLNPFIVFYIDHLSINFNTLHRMKLRVGQTCAACVKYADTGTFSWIITKVERKLSGGKYLVRDESDPQEGFETYTVESNRIAPFPAPPSDDYQVGDRVLALWKDDEDNVWTTEFFEARVVAIKADKKLTIVYKGSEKSTEFDLNENKVTKIPPNFDLFSQSDTENEEEESKPVSEEEHPKEITEVQSTPDEKPKIPPHTEALERRRIQLMFNKPAPVEKRQIQGLSNDDFTELAGPVHEPEVMRTEPGTPLLDSLGDPELFDQEQVAHVTGSGVVALPERRPAPSKSVLMSGNIKCGRLGWILNEWAKCQ